MNGITFQRAQGGLKRRAEGEDHVSALLFYGPEATHLPDLLEVYSLEDAERNKVSATKTPMVHYHVAEFFRVAPGSKLIVRAVPEASYDGNFTEIKQMQQQTAGAIRQIGVWLGHSNTAHEANLNKACQDLAAMNMPLSAVVAYRMTKEELAALPTLGANAYPRVSICIAQDGGGLGASLAKKGGADKPAVTAIGACMGAIARAKVHESIAWVEKQNMVSTSYPSKSEQAFAKELDVTALVDGTLINELTPEQQEVINNKRYLFLRKYVGQAGSYWNDSFTADKADSDYAYIENNRTIDKAVRGIYKSLLPHLSGPLRIDAKTGSIAVGTTIFLETLAKYCLIQMERAGELSGFEVEIDPNQSVLGSSKLNVAVKLVPMGVLRQINVNIGFTVKIEE
ncbi:MAG: DUF2586 family protein [Pedobacter sp.]|nr:MAG: DUF2586 family protein [Pedobacter sp.]